ncbi:MAG TPA: TIGR03936 family radical SAM-associated protein, partial [Blastocatellia bacterium]
LREMGRRYRIDVKVHHAETSLLEGVISRGDRDLCRVIERAWLLGCRFDGWTEHFNFDRWMEAFQTEGIDIRPYLKEFPVRDFTKPTAPLVPLPWDHLDTLVKQEYNAREYMKAIKAKISPPCELPVKVIDGRPTAIAPSHDEFERVAAQPLLCYHCGLECDLTVSREHLQKAFALHEQFRTFEERMQRLDEQIPKSPLVQLVRSQKSEVRSQNENRPPPTPHPPRFRYRAVYAKGEEAKYLSHLDLTRTLPRAFRRAGIRLGYSQGFHPMPLIHYGPALGVGVQGDNEVVDFDSVDDLDEVEFVGRINRALPSGLRFKSVARLAGGASSLIKEINRAEYAVALDAPEIIAAAERIKCERVDSTEDLHQQLIDEFISRETCVIERVRKDKRQRVDVRRYTMRAELDDNCLRIVTEISPSGGVRPVEVVAAIYQMTETEQVSIGSRVRRLRVYSEDESGKVFLPGCEPVARNGTADQAMAAGD